MGHVFISFATADRQHAKDLSAALEERGVRPWTYIEVTPEEGDRFTHAIELAIQACSSFVLLASQNAENSEYVRAEWRSALRYSKKTIVVRVDDREPSRDAFPEVNEIIHSQRIGSWENLWRGVSEIAFSQLKSYCPVVSFSNVKGGVGKTTLIANIAAAFQKGRLAKRVLLIDLDPQFNLSQMFRPLEFLERRHEEDQSVMALFEPTRHVGFRRSPSTDTEVSSSVVGEVIDIERIVDHLRIYQDDVLHQIDIVYGQSEIIKYILSRERYPLQLRRMQFRRFVSSFRNDYDIIFIDTNPGASFLTQCVLDVVDVQVIPITPSAFSLRGLRLMRSIERYFDEPPTGVRRLVIVNRWPRNPNQSTQRLIQGVRKGEFDEQVEWKLSGAMLARHIPLAACLKIGAMGDAADPLRRVVPFQQGQTQGLATVRDALAEVAAEIEGRLTPGSEEAIDEFDDSEVDTEAEEIEDIE